MNGGNSNFLALHGSECRDYWAFDGRADAQFKSIQADSHQLWKIKSYVDSARKNQEQQQNHRKQEPEI